VSSQFYQRVSQSCTSTALVLPADRTVLSPDINNLFDVENDNTVRLLHTPFNFCLLSVLLLHAGSESELIRRALL